MAYPHLGKSIAQLSVLMQSGALDPVALAEESLDAIRSHKDQAIFISLLEERARQEAASASKRLRDGRSRGLLDGIPIAWKDLFAIRGLPTTAGSSVLAREAPAAKDADVVQALAEAGMVSLGRVNMSEFAFSGLGLNPHYGTPLNPVSTDVERVPGALPRVQPSPSPPALSLSLLGRTRVGRCAFHPPSMGWSATRQAVAATAWPVFSPGDQPRFPRSSLPQRSGCHLGRCGDAAANCASDRSR